MKLTELFYKKEHLLHTVTFDAVIEESATTSSVVTSNPVERGASINDHIVYNPMSFNLTGVISDKITNIDTKKTWLDLLSLQANRTIFDLKQGFKTYKNITITSLTHTRNAKTAHSLFFSATLIEIVFVGAEVLNDNDFDGQDIADGMKTTLRSGLKR